MGRSLGLPKERLPRARCHLSESVLHQLNLYIVGATAAAVGVLALAQSSEAEIVYTKAHQLIRLNSTYNLDLNHDGVTDVIISNVGCLTGTINCETAVSAIYAIPLNGNGIEGVRRLGGPVALAPEAGARIGPAQPFFDAYGLMMAAISGGCQQSLGTSWCFVTNRYLGLHFKIKGETHYGWARISTGAPHRIAALLTGYAYETIPDKPIIAGATKEPDEGGAQEPDAALTPPPSGQATLGLLAMGSPTLSIWRRDDPLLELAARD